MNDKFCSECGNPKSTSGHIIQSGSHSVNTIGSEIRDSNIHIGDNINNSNNIAPELLNLQREFFKIPWSKDGSLAKRSTFQKLGTWGSIASIIGVFLPFMTGNLLLQPLVFLMLAIFVPMLMLSLIISSRKFEHFSGLKNFEISNSGKIFITKITGDCPWCGSKMHLRMVGPKGYKQHLLMCNRNPSQHRIIFDPTALSDIGK
ncbi:hypothetical protein [Shewanella insulae]|uniref:hypothetical protein n=1 Tax=Shewanella insulae TaxID=2681496 RepID=UPI00248054E4|nr:hypothetical protein [Shewanella insulae]